MEPDIDFVRLIGLSIRNIFNDMRFPDPLFTRKPEPNFDPNPDRLSSWEDGPLLFLSSGAPPAPAPAVRSTMESWSDAGSCLLGGESIRDLSQSRRHRDPFTSFCLQQTTSKPDPVISWYEMGPLSQGPPTGPPDRPAIESEEDEEERVPGRLFGPDRYLHNLLRCLQIPDPYIDAPIPDPSPFSDNSFKVSSLKSVSPGMEVAMPTTPARTEVGPPKLAISFLSDEDIKDRSPWHIPTHMQEFYAKLCDDFDDDEYGPSVDASTIQLGPLDEVLDYLLNLAVNHYNDHCTDTKKICHPQLLKYHGHWSYRPIIYCITFAAYDDDDDDVVSVDHDKLGVYQAKLKQGDPITDGSYVHLCRRKKGSARGGSISNPFQSRRLPDPFTSSSLQQTTTGDPEPKSDPHLGPISSCYESTCPDFSVDPSEVSHPRPQSSSCSTGLSSDSASLGKAVAVAMTTTPAQREVNSQRVMRFQELDIGLCDDESMLGPEELYEEICYGFDDDEYEPSVDASTIQFGPLDSQMDYLLNLAVKHYNDHRTDSQEICHPQPLKYQAYCIGDPFTCYTTFAAYGGDDVASQNQDKLGVYQAKLNRGIPITDGSYVHFCRRKASWLGRSTRNLFQSRRLPYPSFFLYSLQQTTHNPEPKSDPHLSPISSCYGSACSDLSVDPPSPSKVSHPRSQPFSSSTSPSSDTTSLGKEVAMATTPEAVLARLFQSFTEQGFEKWIKSFTDEGFVLKSNGEDILAQIVKFCDRNAVDFDDDEFGLCIGASNIQCGPLSHVMDYLLNLAVEHYNNRCTDGAQKISHPQFLKEGISIRGDPVWLYLTFAAYSDNDVARVDHDKLGVYQAKVTQRFPVTKGSYVHLCRRKGAS